MISEPKISLNKLGEYLDASPSRRRRIVLDQKAPKNFITTRYSDAREAIVDFIASGMEAEDEMITKSSELRLEEGGSEFVVQDRHASADTIEDFLEVSEQLELDGLVAEKTPKTISTSMEIGGVTVSVRPDVILRDRKTKNIVGAIKLHFSKTLPLSDKSREYIATALRLHLAERCKDVDYKKCYVVDVPAQNISPAPKAYKRKMNDIEAGCEEISARWG